MRDRRTVDELSIEELEEILRLRKAQARLERLRKMRGDLWPRDPLAPDELEGRLPPLPRGHRNYADEGASAGFRARPVEVEAEPRPSRRVNWAWVRDKALLILEIAALIGLVIVLLGTLETLQELNEQARAVQMATVPTPTPTPLIRVAVLPGGHTPPDAQGRSEPVPIPEHLRPLVSSVTPLPVPTPGPEHAIRIRIPSIGVDAPVVEGDDWESLKRGAGHHIGSANPGERGNCIISAHNDIYGEIFRDLPKVQIGDVVEVYTARQVYRYRVNQIRIVEPTDVSVMYPTSTPVLTLISCYPYRVNTHRIVVIAELIP
ncbi:MAG: class D sortase [Anaerolineae bacterium]|nr:class D sortase [Anaerolineae bacterium]MCX8067958.1 class D sortase [Anaerolineae bacterium]MDW7991738.1 class D sortase [Anaerolineae bacterium]